MLALSFHGLCTYHKNPARDEALRMSPGDVLDTLIRMSNECRDNNSQLILMASPDKNELLRNIRVSPVVIDFTMQ